MKERNQLYGGRRPPDYKPAHNHVLHFEDTGHGERGFRRFWIPPEWIGKDWTECPCGWRPDLGKHYALKSFVRHHDTPRKRARERELAAHMGEIMARLKCSELLN